MKALSATNISGPATVEGLHVLAGPRKWTILPAGADAGSLQANEGEAFLLDAGLAAAQMESLLANRIDDGLRFQLLTKLEAQLHLAPSPVIGKPAALARRIGRIQNAFARGTMQLWQWKPKLGGSFGPEDHPKPEARPTPKKRTATPEKSATAKSEPPTPTPAQSAPPASTDPIHWVHFRFLMDGTDFPIHDNEPFTLVHPSGEKETGKLDDGNARRDSVVAGNYEYQSSYLTGIAWETSESFHGEEVRYSISAKNIPDGETILVKIFPAWHSQTGPPLAESKLTLQGRQAWGTWKPIQKVGDSPRGSFLLVATWKTKFAESEPLHLVPHPIDTAKGIQQRLKRLRLYAAAIDGILGPKSQQATKDFQKKHPPLAVDGIAGPLTQAALQAVLY